MKQTADHRPGFRPKGIILPLIIMLSTIGCGGENDSQETATEPQQTQIPTLEPGSQDGFVSALAYSNAYAYDDVAEDAEGGGEEDGGDREVEEADILTQVGNQLYVLNAYRGLQIMDMEDPDAPVMQGRVPITGYPVEMYVKDSRAYVVVSDYYTYWPSISLEDSTTSSFRGSALAIIDIEDPNAPVLLGKINVEGYIGQTRAVGDVIYAVSTRYASYDCYGTSEDNETTTFVTSVDISDPTNPTQVDLVEWPGSSAQIHATSDTLYVAETLYGYTTEDVEEHEGDNPTGEEDDAPENGGNSSTDNEPDPSAEAETPEEDTPGEAEEEPTDEPVEPSGSSYYSTQITIVDISDPHGLMDEQGMFTVPGATWDKFALNEFEDTFRIVTQKWDGYTSGTLSVIDISDHDTPAALSTMDIVLPILESVTATRFDGDRAYIVTAERTDPLFIVDLADPSEPYLAGELEMPGQLEHLEPRGDRLIAFGMDNEEEGTWRFAISLFDVEDIEDPIMLDRETVGAGDYSWSSATWDDKSFSILDDSGLIAVPFTAWGDDGSYFGGVQLTDFDDSTLELRGHVTHPGYVQRVRAVNERLVSLSDTDLLVIDASDRDLPQVTAEAPMARYIADYLPMDDLGVQLVTGGWYWYNNSPTGSLRLVDGDTPSTLQSPLASVEVPISDGQLFRLEDNKIGLVSNSYDEDWNLNSTLSLFAITDGPGLELLSSTELPGPLWSYASMYGNGYGTAGGSLVQMDSVIAYLETSYNYYYYDYEVDVEEGEQSEGSEGSGGSDDGNTTEPDQEDDGEDNTPTSQSKMLEDETEVLSTLHIIDLGDATNPVITSIDFENSLFGLFAGSHTLYTSYAVQLEVEGPAVAQYYLQGIDLSDAQTPILQEAVNVPGTAFKVLDDDTTFLTVDGDWHTTEEGYQYEAKRLNAVAVQGNTASRLSDVALPGYIYGLSADDEAVYALSQPFWWEQNNEYCYYSTAMALLAVDASDTANLSLATSQDMPISYGYLRAHEGDHLFVDGYTGGVMIYDLSTPLEPSYQSFARTSGYVLKVRAGQSTAYMPTGMYGVFTSEL